MVLGSQDASPWYQVVVHRELELLAEKGNTGPVADPGIPGGGPGGGGGTTACIGAKGAGTVPTGGIGAGTVPTGGTVPTAPTGGIGVGGATVAGAVPGIVAAATAPTVDMLVRGRATSAASGVLHT